MMMSTRLPKLLLTTVSLILVIVLGNIYVYADSVSCNGSYATSNAYYTYPNACAISCQYGGYGTLYYDALEVPNHFSIGGVNTALNGGWVGRAEESGPWGAGGTTASPVLIANPAGSYNFTFSSSTYLRVDTDTPDNRTDGRTASVTYTCNGAPACSKPSSYTQYQCSGNDRQQRTYDDTPGVCARGSWSTIETCSNGCSSGTCNTSTYSCTGNTPANAQLCQDDAVGLTADTARSLVSSCSAAKCEYTCNPGSILNGGICESIYAQYTCNAGSACAGGSNGARTANASCGGISYNPSTIYDWGNTICNDSAPNASQCKSTCQAASCGATAGTCSVGSLSNDNGSTSCGTTRTWQCGGENCSHYNGACVGDGLCGSSVGSCLSPVPATSVTATTWTCPGSNGGNPDYCSYSAPGYCGDNVVNQSWEDCDGTDLRGAQSCTSGCKKSCSASYRCTGTNSRQGLVDNNCNVDGSIDTRYGECCVGSEPNAYRQGATAAGSSYSNFSCNGINLTRQQPNGNCGYETVSKRCDDISGRPAGSNFGPNDQDRSGYFCLTDRCAPVPSIYAKVLLCNLTGTNLAQRCTQDMLVNFPYGNRRTSGGGTRVGTPSSWDAAGDMYVGLLESNGQLSTADGDRNPRTSTRGSVGQAFIWGLNPGSTYHTYVTYDPDFVGMKLPPGWVQLYGPSSGAVTYGLTHWDVRGGGSYGWSSIVSPGSGMRITLGSDKAYAYSYFYCSDPSGECPQPYRFSINTFHDKANDGIRDSYAYENAVLGGVFVRVSNSSGVVIYSGYTQDDGNGPTYYDRDGNAGQPAYKKGTYTISLLSDETYTVNITPKSGYAPADNSQPRHYVGANDLDNNSAINSCGKSSIPWGYNSIESRSEKSTIGGDAVCNWTSLSGTSFSFTMPRQDVYVRTRLAGIASNLALKTSADKPWYNIGDTVKITYMIDNLGYSASSSTQIMTHILTGLQVVPGSMVFSGDCDSRDDVTPRDPLSGSEPRQITTGAVDTCGSRYNSNTDAVNCSCVTQSSPGCDLDFLNRSMVTWTNNTGIPVVDQSIYPGVTYPPLSSDLTTNGQFNYYNGYRKVVPKGSFVYVGRTSGNSSPARLRPGAQCEVVVDYKVIAGAVTGNTYIYRSCISPRAWEDARTPWVGDNCDNVSFRVGQPNCALPASLGGGSISAGSGIVAWYEPTVGGDQYSYCQSEYRQCVSGILSGSYTNLTCVKQCQQTWTSGATVQVNPGSTIVAQNAFVATPAQNCECKNTDLLCSPVSITGGALADPGGRAYTGGSMQGPSGYDYPALPTCQLSSACTCIDKTVDLYEVHYTMSGNTVLGNNRVIDQVHPNVCLIPSTFTGRLANNEVRVTFYSGASVTATTGTALFGPVSGSTLAASSWTGLICGPYVEYEFAKPLYPGAEGYFFYEFKLKETVSQNPNANSGSNCVWIYRETNNDYFVANNALTSIQNLSRLDPGDSAQRFSGSNSWSTFIRFYPIGQLDVDGNNYVCVPPPSSFCPANTIQQKTQIPVNLCGNGVQEINEECDDGYAPYVSTGRNNDDGSIRYTGLNYDDPLYDNYCKTDCTLGEPLVCNWIASCSNANVTSIQEGEEYPFWWNLGQVIAPNVQYNDGFTRSCTAPEHVNKIMIGGGYAGPLCTFEVRNFYNDGSSSGSLVLHTFVEPCIGTGISNLTMFDPLADKWANEKADISINSTSQGGNTEVVSKNSSVFESIDKHTLDQILPRILSSQGSRLISLTGGVTRGRLGEYEIRLTKLEYQYCNQESIINRNPDGSISQTYSYSIETGNDTAINGFCSNQFIVTKPYVVQEGSLLSTLTGSDFSKFYTSATRLLDQSVESTYGNDVVSRTTQIPTYVSTIGTSGEANNEFVRKFIDKYSVLATRAGTKFTYSHGFDNLSGAASRGYDLYKVPTRDIFVYTGTNPLFLSDYAFKNSLSAGSMYGANPLTIISPNADIVIFGDMISKNIMVITEQNLIFAGGSLSDTAQKVTGIFVSNGYAGSTLQNNNTNKRWIDDGRLVVNGILIGPSITDLSNRRRSVIENWYNGSGTVISESAVLAKRKKSLIEGASLRIIPNPQLFTSPPPGSDELFRALSVGK